MVGSCTGQLKKHLTRTILRGGFSSGFAIFTAKISDYKTPQCVNDALSGTYRLTGASSQPAVHGLQGSQTSSVSKHNRVRL